MITKGQKELFLKSIIAQHDDEDYEESGWVAVVIGNWAALANYSHCSCYGTWTSITGGGILDDEGPEDPKWDWEGTVEELINIAEQKSDPTILTRTIIPEDSDADHLLNVYAQIIKWKDNRNKTPDFTKKTRCDDLEQELQQYIIAKDNDPYQALLSRLMREGYELIFVLSDLTVQVWK